MIIKKTQTIRKLNYIKTKLTKQTYKKTGKHKKTTTNKRNYNKLKQTDKQN